ncbi:MAG: VC_2705 family sodium/solute symporter, partial [Alphaproteobacteria bacterium]
LEIDAFWGLLLGACVVFAYAVFGGMKGITYTQVAQYCVLISAYTVPAIFISFQLTGNPIPQIAFIGDLSDGTGPLLHRLNEVVTDLGFLEYTQGPKEMIDVLAITIALMVGTAGLPHVIVRFFTVPKVRDARSSAGWALVFIALLYTVAPAVGAMARYNLTTTVQFVGMEVGDPEANLVYEDRPDWFGRWEVTGLLKFEDKNGDGRIQYYNDKNAEFAAKAEGWGWKGNELTVNRDIMVLANPEIAQLPDWVIALVAAGGIAAALSTAAGLLLVISAGISHDLMKGTLTPDISEKTELMAGRVAAATAICIAGYLGYNPPGFVAQVVAFAFGLAASSLFPAIMMGIFSKTINNKGAVAGMLVGLVTTLVYIFLHKGWFFIPGTNTFDDSDPLLLTIKSTSFGAVGAMLTGGPWGPRLTWVG